MKISISWNTQQTTEKAVKDVASNESSFWEAVGKQLLEIPIPTTVDIESPVGNVRLKVRQRGTYTKNGTKKTFNVRDRRVKHCTRSCTIYLP